MRYYADIKESLIHAIGSSTRAHRVIHFAIVEVHPNFGVYLTAIPPDEVTNLVDPVDHLIFIKFLDINQNYSIPLKKKIYQKYKKYI